MKNPTNDDAYDVLFRSYELANKQIKEIQAQFAYEQERRRNNVANAQLQIDELTSEYQTWRMACGKARERADAAVAEMQAMVSRLTKLAKEFQTEETWDGKRNDALRYCAGRLRKAISGEV